MTVSKSHGAALSLYLERRRYALHGDRPAHPLRRDTTLAEVDGDGERVAEGDGSEEHLNTDEKILVACRHGSWGTNKRLETNFWRIIEKQGSQTYIPL